MAAISFARGAPSPECLDEALIADCARAALERDGTTILSYGAGGGYGPLRELLAEQHGVEPGRVFLTTGGLQGFVFYAAVQLALRPGRVLVEGPTYDRPLKILAREGAEVVPLAMDDEGLDLDALEAELGRGGDDLVPLHDPDVPEPVRALDRDGTPPPARRDRSRIRSPDPRGRSVWPCALRGRASPLAPRDRGGRARDVHVVVLEDGRPGTAHRLLRRARRASSPPTTTAPSRRTSHPACCPRRRSTSSCCEVPSCPTSIAFAVC